MSATPKVSVVTPSFNSSRTIRETIESVRAQDYPHWEHLVMDGASSDATLDILKEYPHLQWISEKDEGHYHAMNKGILRGTGEIVAILNADDCYLPGTLSAVGKAFAAHPDWDALFGDIIYIDGEGREIYRREEAVYDYDVLRFSGVCYVIHPTLFVRRSAHDRLGLYRHNEFKNACDLDFILRLGRARCRVGHLPRYLVRYRWHNYGQSADLRISRNMAREAAVLCREHGRPEGWRGMCLQVCFRLKRQMQKFVVRRKVDLIPGTWKLRPHMKAKTEFSSNCGLDKL